MGQLRSIRVRCSKCRRMFEVWAEGMSREERETAKCSECEGAVRGIESRSSERDERLGASSSQVA